MPDTTPSSGLGRGACILVKVSPLLSLVVVVYDMPEQARRTLRSLAPGYQKNVSSGEYEIIVVENVSPRLLGRDAAEAVSPNVRYVLHEGASRSPGPAANLGVSLARGDRVGLLIDGARLLTPGVVELALMASRMTDRAVLSVPGYHLGERIQQEAADGGYDEAAEAALLERIAWPEDGYRLFEVACFSGSLREGFLVPFSESNCLCLAKRLFDELGGFDPAFASAGGGFVNLDLYERIVTRPDVTLFVTPGEGTFHQFHGGVSTGGVRGEERERMMEAFVREYEAIRGRAYAVPGREALLLGAIPPAARRFFRRSAAAFDGAMGG